MASTDAALTDDDVRSAYNIFLRRPPESDAAIQRHIERSANRDSFRQNMLMSKEFYDRNYLEIARFVISSAPISISTDIETLVDDDKLKLLFDHIQNVWSELGESDPHFSVLSTEKFRARFISENQNDFYDSGRSEVDTTFKRLALLGLWPKPDGRAVELGAGVGRVTRYLGERFAHVTGYDISANHLALAKAYIDDSGIKNIDLEQIKSVRDMHITEHDFFYSRIVLQHNPPPIIAHILDKVFCQTLPNGILVFQLMTARTGYKFDAASYLSGMADLNDQELHVLPQSEIFKLFTKHGITCVEVFRDGALRGFDRTSTTFIGQKR
jgi:SAM-dependent methyltransferase